MRKVWYVLAIDGRTRGCNACDSELLPEDSDVADLRRSVKASCASSLTEVDARELLVYANQAAFAGDLEHSLRASRRLQGLGLSEDDHVVVRAARSWEFLWREPRALVCAANPGASWDFQDSAVNKEAIQQDLKVHSTAWRQESPSEQCHPVFVCCDGPGTGKSRLLDEFPAMVKTFLFADDECTEALDEEGRAIRHELSQNVYTFKITFKEPTPVRPVLVGHPDLMVGTRMLYQMCEPTPWDVFLADPRNHVTPSAALRRLSSVVNREQKKLCVIICADDMHMLRFESGSRTDDTAAFIVGLDSLRTLANSSGCLVTVLVATKRSQAMMDFHHYSTQWTRYLQTAVLSSPMVNGCSVFAGLAVGMQDSDSEATRGLIQLLIDDMGGHARALEILASVMLERESRPFDFILTLTAVLVAMQNAFPAIQDHVDAMKKALRAVLARRIVYTSSHFGDLSLDQVVSCGLIRRRGDHLECSFVLYLLLETQGAPWYSRGSNNVVISASKPLGDLLRPWQLREKFECSFRELRAEAVAEDDSKPLSLFPFRRRRCPTHDPEPVFYGPFASRAEFLEKNHSPYLNSSSQWQLQLVHEMNGKLSARIVMERPFGSYEDAHKKTGILLEILQQFQLTGPAVARE